MLMEVLFVVVVRYNVLTKYMKRTNVAKSMLHVIGHLRKREKVEQI